MNHLSPPASVHPASTHLTPREQEITCLIAFGLVNKQIANRLNISVWTVSAHLRRIFNKLNVDTRAAVVYKCAPLIQDQADRYPEALTQYEEARYRETQYREKSPQALVE